jgi:hypothetical protein
MDGPTGRAVCGPLTGTDIAAGGTSWSQIDETDDLEKGPLHRMWAVEVMLARISCAGCELGE